MADVEVVQTVTRLERSRFKKLDELVQMHGRLFVHVGQALKEIRDGKLYREQFDTFEDYVAQRCGWSVRRAYQLVEAAETVTALNADSVNPGSHFSDEKAVRPLVSLAPVDRSVVLDVLRRTHPDVQTYTAAHVTSAIKACQFEVPVRVRRAPDVETTARRIAELVARHPSSEWPEIGKRSLVLAEQIAEAHREH